MAAPRKAPSKRKPPAKSIEARLKGIEERQKGQEARQKGQESRQEGQEERQKGQEARQKTQETGRFLPIVAVIVAVLLVGGTVYSSVEVRRTADKIERNIARTNELILQAQGIARQNQGIAQLIEEGNEDHRCRNETLHQQILDYQAALAAAQGVRAEVPTPDNNAPMECPVEGETKFKTGGSQNSNTQSSSTPSRPPQQGVSSSGGGGQQPRPRPRPRPTPSPSPTCTATLPLIGCVG